MKKLMMAIASAVAIGSSAFAEAQEWFDGGVSNGWPTATSMKGGAWANDLPSAQWAEDVAEWNATVNRLDIYATNDLSFVVTDPKQLDATAKAVSYSASIEFYPFTSQVDVTPANAKGGVAVVAESDATNFWVLAKDPDAATNKWTKTALEGVLGEEVPVVLTVTNGAACGSIVYKLGDAEPLTYDIAIGDKTFTSVNFTGDGALSSLTGEFTENYVTLKLPEDPENVGQVIVSNVTDGVAVDKVGGLYPIPYNSATRPDGTQVQVWIYAKEGYLFSNGKNFKMYEETMTANVDKSGETPENPTEAPAKIGTTYYLTLNAAFDAAKSNDTVTLCTDVSQAVVTVPAAVTLDLTENFTISDFETVTNKGTIVVYDYELAESLEDLEGTLKAGVELDDGDKFYWPAGTTVTCTKEAVGDDTIVRKAIVVGEGDPIKLYEGIKSYEQVTVKGDVEFRGDVQAGLSEQLVSKLTVDGDLTFIRSFEIGAYAEMSVSGALDRMIGDETIVLKATTSKLVNDGELVADEDVVTDLGGDYKVCKASGVYQAGIPTALNESQYYLTLLDAVQEVQDGETIELLADVAQPAFCSKENLGVAEFEIDLGAHTFTNTSGVIEFYKGSTVTIKNGTLCRTEGAATAWLVRSYAQKIIFEDVIIDAAGITKEPNPHGDKPEAGQYYGVVTATNGGLEFNGETSIINIADDVNAVIMENYANATGYSLGELKFDILNGEIGGRIMIGGGTLNIADDSFITDDTRFLVGAGFASYCTEASIAGQGFKALLGTFPTAPTGKNYVMAYTGELFFTLAAAVDAAGDDENRVKLLADGWVTDVGTIDKAVSLDLNGNTFTVAKGDHFEITEDGGLYVENSVTNGTGGLVVAGDVEVNGELNLNYIAYGAGGLIAHQGGQLKIGENAYVTFMEDWSGISPNLLMAQTPGFMTAVEGATVNTGDDYVYNGALFLKGDESAVATATVTCKIVGTEQTADYLEGYDTLADALGAVKTDGTVTLLTDNEEEDLTIPESVTLDLTADYSIVTNGLVNNGTIKIYQPADPEGLAKLEEYANVVGTLLAAVDIADAEESEDMTMFYPEGTTLTLTTETIGENVRPTLTVDVPATKTVLWKNGVAPYKKMVVNGDVRYAGDISYGWSADKLPTELEVAGNLTLLDCVVITNFGSIKVTGGDLNVGMYDICLQSTTAKVVYDGNLSIGEDIVTSVPNGDVVYKDGVYSVETEVIEYATLTITAGDNVSNVVVTNAAGEEVTGETKFVKSDATVVAVKSYTLANGYELDAANSVLTVTLSEDAEIKVNAKPILVTSVTLDITSTNVAPEAVFTLSATVAPDTALDPSIDWVTSDETVATVDNGTVTAVAVGTATITATNAASGKFATCTVTVESAGPTPGIDTKVTPVPGEENTYKVEPTGSSTVVAVDNVTPGDKLVISATVTEIQVNEGEQSGAIIRVRNSGDTADIPNGAMYGWDGNSFGTALDPDGYVTDEETGDDIPVTPTIGEETEGIKIETPFQAGDTPSATVLAIPGLTYQLMRGNEPSTSIATSGEAASEATVATGSTITLTDDNKPEGKAFYQIKVTK